MTPTTADAYRLFHDGVLALSVAEHNGVAIDVELLDRTIEETAARSRAIEEELKQTDVWKVWQEEYGRDANLGSNPQLERVLYDRLGIEFTGEKTATGRRSVGQKALQDVKHPFVSRLFEMRDLDKTVGTFLKGMRREVVDGLMHPFFHLHTAASFRGSSSDINFQNLPRRDENMSRLVRSCVVPRRRRKGRRGRIGELDFKGIEVALAAIISGDPVLRGYVCDKKTDMHRDMAMQLYCLEKDQVHKAVRNSAKQWFVFAEFYGDYYVHCAKNLWETVDREKLKLADGTSLRKHLRRVGLRDMGDCDPGRKGPPRPGTYEAHVRKIEEDFWGRRFKVYAQWKRDVWAAFQRDGEIVSPTGFRFTWAAKEGRGGSGLLGRKEAANYPIQGSAFHCLLWTLVRLQRWLRRNKMESCIIGQIHDSIVMDLVDDEVQAILTEACRIVVEDLPRHWSWICVPLEIEIEVADVGAPWFAKRPWVQSDNGVWGPRPSEN